MPTLLLVTGVVAADALRRDRKTFTVEAFFFRLTLGLSIFYLLLVDSVLLLRPFTGFSPMALMKHAGLLLGPLQGLVSGALGAFFVSRE
jgi:hypothetical protein